MTIAVDFDGTCVKHKYPSVGEDIGAVPILQKLAKKNKIILYTMRDQNLIDGHNCLAEAVDWFKQNEIPLYGVNENPSQKNWNKSRKVYANLYIDDAALGVPIIIDEEGNRFVDWNRVEKMLINIL